VRPIPCPKCGAAPFMVGPDGGRQRRCWTCNPTWTPPARVEAAARWLSGPHGDRLADLVSGIREEKPGQTRTPPREPGCKQTFD
jgi:hypothetical protein